MQKARHPSNARKHLRSTHLGLEQAPQICVAQRHVHVVYPHSAARSRAALGRALALALDIDPISV